MPDYAELCGIIRKITMTDTSKFKICSYSLLLSGIIMLASGMQLEATGSRGIVPVWIHVAMGAIFTVLVFVHIALHFKRSNWFRRFVKLKSRVTNVMWWLFVLTVVSGIAASVMWLVHATHSPLGGIHGKIGFVMLAVAAGHTVKRKRFFLR